MPRRDRLFQREIQISALELVEKVPHNWRKLGEDIGVRLRRQVGYRIDKELARLECSQLKAIPRQLARLASERLAVFFVRNQD